MYMTAHPTNEEQPCTGWFLDNRQLLAFQSAVKACDMDALSAFFREIQRQHSAVPGKNGTIPAMQLTTLLMQTLSAEGMEREPVFDACLQLLATLPTDVCPASHGLELKRITHRTARLLSESRRTRGRSGTLLEKILDYVEENCHRDTLTLHGAAKELGFSAGYLGDYFKRVTGINFTDHLTRVRLQRACRMLADSNSKTYEIAFSCGFSNAHYFSVVFKKYTGATPTQYRARHRAGGAQTDRTFCNDLELRGKSAHG